MKNPKVSVVMPTYNREEFIKSALDSVLRQTFDNFELIVVDDGSKDNTIEIIKSYDDKRIRLVQNSVNSGVAVARNIGYRHAKGEYVVIADSDDINLPTKFEEQVQVLENNMDIDIVGCIYKPFNEKGFLPEWHTFEENDYIRSQMIFLPGVPAASMFRLNKIKEKGLLYHDESYTASVDYEWFSKMPDDIKFYNIQKPLYLYRWHYNQISSKGLGSQKKCAWRIRQTIFDRLRIIPNELEIRAHEFLCEFYDKDNNDLPNNLSFRDILNWVEKLIDFNNKYKIYNLKSFEFVVSKRFFDLCEYYGQHGRKVWGLWDIYKYKNLVDNYKIVIDLDKLKRLSVGKKVAVLGTLRNAYQIISKLETLNIKISYIIDNSSKKSEFDGYPVFIEKILLEDSIDILILSNLSDSRFILKEKLEKKHRDLEVILIDQLV